MVKMASNCRKDPRTAETMRKGCGNGAERGRTKFTTSGAHDVIAITSPQKNDLCTEEVREHEPSSC